MYFRYRRICYSITAGAIGSILGTLITYVIYIRGRQVLTKGMTLELPIIPTSVAFVTTEVVCLLSSISPSKSLFKSSIVESIRAIE
jgi:putative ABC transport system permease protein